MTTAQKWLRLIAWLRRNFPTEHISTIKSITIKEYGYTEFKNSPPGYGFCVKINRKQCFALRVETLIHEWAHALTWFGAETHLDDHSAEWGITYARIYRTFIEWNWGKGTENG